MSTSIYEENVLAAVPPVTAAAESAGIREDPEESVVTKKPKRKKKKFVIAIIVIAVIAAAVWYFFLRGGGQTAQAGASYTDYTVGTRDITLNLSGTGSLKPADQYTVTTLISGEILSAPFEEGDIVEKDTTLYEVDSSDVSTSIEQAQNNLASSRRSYEQKVKTLDELNVKANESGTVVELLVEEGDKVSAGQTVARIRNSSVMSLTVPFGSDDVANFYVGQSAEVTLDGSFERLPGTISKIGAIEERMDGNMLVRTVTIDVENPGGIATDQAATATVGDAACSGSGTFSYKGESTVTAGVAGEVSAIHIKEGGFVSKNQLIITLKSDSLQNDVLNSAGSLRDSELSLENRYSQLDNYTIKSPIAGTIIEKYYKEGDTLESGKVLCTIFDLSYLTMTLNVDELDIAQIEVGQPVTVTAEALSGKTYNGYVTKVNINGTTSNGVTSYPVTIRIDETDGLLPGMNVQASIIVSQSKDTIAIPVSALSRGNRVLVKADAQQGAAPVTPGTSGGDVNGEGFPSGDVQAGDLPSGGFPDMSTQGTNPADRVFAGANAPDGYTYVQVTPGISDGEYIEILSGLKAGDVIAVTEIVIDFSSQNGMFMMPAGGMNQGARPAQTQGGLSNGVYRETTVVVGG